MWMNFGHLILKIQKYKLQYNQQFYTNEIKLSNNEYKYDAFVF